MWATAAASLLLALLCAVALAAPLEVDERSASDCDVTTDQLVECGRRYIDTNADGYTDADEIEAARTRYIRRGLLGEAEYQAAQKLAPIWMILRDCNADHLGRISEHAFRAAPKCMGKCFMRQRFNAWICERAAADRGDRWPPH
jgi:hypothetical protein